VIFTTCAIEGVLIVEAERREDERGFFARLWCARELAEHGLDFRIAQINVQVSPRARTLRGLHFQEAPFQEVKTVRCTRGRVFDVAVDLRAGSATYCKWIGIEMCAGDAKSILVPEGCAHGYLTLEPETEVVYLTSEFYAPDAARGVRFDDPAIDIRWPYAPAVISSADRGWPLLDPERPR
jgi:dTDP-4-dehydrorhamnose 3,5-epimerase